jgi:N-dimethylarginine dimethylaminohydrolase
LRDALTAAGALVETIDPTPDLPDLVFTANAAVVLDRKVVLSRFRYSERQKEEAIFAAGFAALRKRGVVDDVCRLPPEVILEGAGDCIWDARRRLFWLGCGFRSDASAVSFLTQQLGRPALMLPLAQPRFYHLDTAFCVLPCGTLMYYPEAFTPAAQATIDAHVAPEHRVALDRADAKRFAANAVCVHNTIVLSSCSKPLRSALQERGYTVVETPLQAFLRSGGSACCLTLRLDHRSEALSVRSRQRQRVAASSG